MVIFWFLEIIWWNIWEKENKTQGTDVEWYWGLRKPKQSIFMKIGVYATQGPGTPSREGLVQGRRLFTRSDSLVQCTPFYRSTTLTWLVPRNVVSPNIAPAHIAWHIVFYMILLGLDFPRLFDALATTSHNTCSRSGHWSLEKTSAPNFSSHFARRWALERHSAPRLGVQSSRNNLLHVARTSACIFAHQILQLGYYGRSTKTTRQSSSRWLKTFLKSIRSMS